jgi:hypothetical protein
VFFAGLPATGKSLLVRDLAQVAHAARREVRLLQWDVARPVFEASDAGRRYPVVNGVTDPLIRKAVGEWSREAIGEWERQAGPEAILIGETPFIGGRLIELAGRADDQTEKVLTSPACRFVLVAPSNSLRRHIESERERRASSPANAGEREEAPPHLLRAMWLDLLEAGRAMNVDVAESTGGTASYERSVYERVYVHLLRHRRFEILSIEEVIDTGGRSAYDFDFPVSPLLPSAAECERFITEAEANVLKATGPWWEV